MLTREDKKVIIDKIKANIDKSNGLFLTNLIGLDGVTAVQVRKRVRDAKGSLIVTKNSLFRIGAQGTYAEELLKGLKGTNAIAFSFEDAPAVAKAILDSTKDSEIVTMGAGYLDQKQLTKEEVKALASLPSRDQMLGTLLATFNAPVSAFVRVLEAIRAQKDGSTAAAAQ